MKIYAGIDVSKDKLDIALTKDGNKILSTIAFQNSMINFQRLLNWIKKHSDKNSLIRVCIEVTGIYHEGISEFLSEKENFIVSIINPFQSKAFADSIISRTKTDKVGERDKGEKTQEPIMLYVNV
jgi:transposase